VTDGERVIVWFGSAGAVAYDRDGAELWKRDLGKQNHEWGYAASPVLQGDLCFLNFGPGETSFLIALNKKTGETVWREDLPLVQPKSRTDGFAGRQGGVVGSWSTPALVPVGGETELVVSLPEVMRAFDPSTGRTLWTCEGLNPLIYTSPIFGGGVVVGMGGYAGTAVAVRVGGRGDVTRTHRLWRKERTANRIGSGVIHAGHIYILNTPGVAECLELETGRVVWEERLRGPGPTSESWSSMVLAGDRIYVVNQSGDTLVLRASPRFEVLAANSIGTEKTNATLAVADNQIFLRTHQHLWCFAASESESK
jgi:outer membrane protein assembly factor BamB